jgi:hypothetical protein
MVCEWRGVAWRGTVQYVNLNCIGMARKQSTLFGILSTVLDNIKCRMKHELFVQCCNMCLVCSCRCALGSWWSCSLTIEWTACDAGLVILANADRCSGAQLQALKTAFTQIHALHSCHIIITNRSTRVQPWCPQCYSDCACDLDNMSNVDSAFFDCRQCHQQTQLDETFGIDGLRSGMCC